MVVVVRDVLGDGVCDDCVDEIVEAMMLRRVFPLPCLSIADVEWQGVGFEERVTDFAWCGEWRGCGYCVVVTSRVLQGMSRKEGVVQGCYEMRWCEVGGSGLG